MNGFWQAQQTGDSDIASLQENFEVCPIVLRPYEIGIVRPALATLIHWLMII